VALCRRQLRPLGRDLFQRATLDLRNFKNLHEMRIAGKRLRYALELAVAVIPTRVHKRLYEALNQLQDGAGAVCDERSFLDSTQDWLEAAKKKKSRERLKKLLTQQRRRYDAAHRKFLRFWSQARRRQIESLWKKAI